MSMWNKLATFRDNISQIAASALDVPEEELESGTSDREGEDGQASPSKVRSQADGRRYLDFLTEGPHHSSTNGVPPSAVEEPRFDELRMKCENLEARCKVLLTRLQESERAYTTVNENCTKALEENERLKVVLAKVQLDLSISNAQVQKEREDAGVLQRRLDEETSRIRETAPSLETTPQSDDDRWAEELRLKDEEVARLQERALKAESDRSKLKEELELARTSQNFEPESDAEKDEAASINEALREKSQQVDDLLQKLRTLEERHAHEKSVLGKKLEAVVVEKDKAVSNLTRLKQHLLDKENEDSEKMDRDSEQIAMLEEKLARSSGRVQQLEQALSSLTDASKRSSDELQKAKSEVDTLQRKLNDYMSALESKDVELSNLQSVLGQYMADIEAKERLEAELRIAKDALRRLTADLEASRETVSVKENARVDALMKAQLAEQRVLATQEKMRKGEQDIARLRHALEQSVVRINRMSSDSDFSVDRRIVIKLLVTYFERNHSREVLDLMSRILGFSDDDKRRVGLAHQNAGKTGVVRSVLGLPGRMVGGLWASGSEPSPNLNSRPFADLWIDFLLKEAEEKADSEAPDQPQDDQEVTRSSVGDPEATTVQVSGRSLVNGYARDDIFASDTEPPEEKKGHRRVLSRP